MARFTFKREPRETGLASIASPNPNTQIKFGGKVVGIIFAPSRFSHNTGWQVGLMIEDATASCGWAWIRFTRQDENELDARTWLQSQADNILAKYSLYCQED